MPRTRLAGCVTLLLAVSVPATFAQTPLTTERILTGLASPLYVTAPPGDFERLFIVEQGASGTARIKIYNLTTGSLNATPFLTKSGIMTGGERGLLGLAFHPDYAANGYFYINYTTSGGGAAGQTIVSRYSVSSDPDLADTGSELILLSIGQPYSNHNGGWIAFGPDGYLYISMGDGGSGGDPGNRAQDITDMLLGKLLRIDVDNDDFPSDPARNYAIPADNPFTGSIGDDEIWAYGLRNAWRCAFDRATGDLYIADVGQGSWEEVDFQSADSTGGENYGWRCYEGFAPYNTTGCPPAGTMVFPIHVYSHSEGCSITGGYVYRGGEICDLQGTYFFADYCSNTIWSFRYEGGSVTEFQNRTSELDPPVGSINTITSFGEDAAGEMYIVDGGGEIYKILPDGPLNGDMNNDGFTDFGDINPFVLALTNPDLYASTYGVAPEEAGDLNCDGVCDFGDINPFVLLLSS